MKHLSLLIISCIFIVGSVFAHDNEYHFKYMNKEANPEHHKQRKEWLETMHRTEYGVDYKLLRGELQLSRMEQNQKMRDKLTKDSPQLLKYVSENGRIAGTWKERGSNNQSGRIHTADADLIDGLIYVASAGGNVWRGTIDGKDWVCLNNSTQFSISSLKVEHYGDFRRIFAFDHKNLYYSDNEGYTWENPEGLENIGRWGHLFRGVVIRNTVGRTLYILTLEWDYDAWKAIKSIYYSTDDGKTFERLLSVDNTDAIDIWGIEHSRGEYGYENHSGEINIANDNLFYIHKDSLFSINKSNVELLNVYNEINAFDPRKIRLSGTDAAGEVHLYFNINSANFNTPITYVSNDLGESIIERSIAPENYFMTNSFGASKLNPDFAILGGVDCYTTSDGGNSWNKINGWAEYYKDPLNKLHADIPGIKSFKIADDKEFFLISTDGGIYKTRDDNTVENISLEGLNVSQYYSVYTYIDDFQSVIYAGSQDQGYQRSEIVTDKVLDFEQTISGDYGSLTSGDNGKSIWTVYPGFAMFYPDALNSNRISTWNFRDLSNAKVWMPPIVAIPGNPYKAYVSPGGSKTGSSNIWMLEYIESTNSISTTELDYQFNANEEDNFVTALSISTIDKSHLYALTRKGKFYTSTDSGTSWTETPEFIGPGYNYLHGTSIYASKRELGVVYIAGSGYSNEAVFVTADNGQTFTAIEGLPPSMVYQIDMNTDESALFAATSIGPYIYIIEQNEWYHIAGLDAPDQHYWSVNYIPAKNIARFATYGRGIWDFEIEKLFTSVTEKQTHNTEYLKVFPNPASDKINIQFQSSSGSYVKIKIMDLEGRLIGVLFEGNANSDMQEVTVNITDLYNLASGNYIVTMTSGDMLKYQLIQVVK
jgi:hypothetical protein